MFLALKEMKRAKLRFGLLAGAVGLLVFLILFQQALLSGLVNQFIGALKHQSGDVLVYSDQARKNLEGSIILPGQLEQVAAGRGRGGRCAARRVHLHGHRRRRGARRGDLRVRARFTGCPHDAGGRSTAARPRAKRWPARRTAPTDSTSATWCRCNPTGWRSPSWASPATINYSVAPVLFVDFATFEDAKRTRNPDATRHPPVGHRRAGGRRAPRRTRWRSASPPRSTGSRR